MFICLQVLYDIHFKQSSVNDIGTMCSNMNVIHNVNAKTNNVLDNFNSCKDYTNNETDALIVAATLEHFGMESIDTSKKDCIPHEVLTAPTASKRVWLHEHVKKILDVHIIEKLTSEHDEIRRNVHKEANPPPRPQRCLQRCIVCQKAYFYAKSLENHQKKEHPDHRVEPISELKKTQNEVKEQPSKAPISDDRYNYACARLRMGLLLRNFDDAVKEGDGERTLRC